MGGARGFWALVSEDFREQAGVDRAGNILRDNHYGWFERVRVGHYALTPRGRREWDEWSIALASLEAEVGTPAQTG